MALSLTLQHAVTGKNLVTWDDLEEVRDQMLLTKKCQAKGAPRRSRLKPPPWSQESTTASQLRQSAASALGLRDVSTLRPLAALFSEDVRAGDNSGAPHPASLRIAGCRTTSSRV